MLQALQLNQIKFQLQLSMVENQSIKKDLEDLEKTWRERWESSTVCTMVVMMMMMMHDIRYVLIHTTTICMFYYVFINRKRRFVSNKEMMMLFLSSQTTSRCTFSMRIDKSYPSNN